ncbi:transcriptional regulator, Sir2 family protein [Trichomonas vaginalis G3]|uniref:Transcriptional regulator, Sir2 family protein n=1 Tax=Trichomonas vaginalis (strain ATCC PRA-98 / G3) TaxID=412133 RepID=A2DKF0_TRIV3|nr:NAD+ binding [Trichomonas vaginalis G3]EAY19127.1 transcriptional regulator, Sir2 family protein [Trichomonas vaginalis G3]KAI5490424.1 NAD+ binding [Trichomonas vaginalis G3]|eukprot:XP_001580113.1 transcriptional regulator, Sir2 family protein [Trichomonas vaginalis G3]
MRAGNKADEVFKTVVGKEPQTIFSEEVPEAYLWNFLIQFAREQTRQRVAKARKPIQSMEDIIKLIENSKHIIVIIGAGASIGPDFRSPGGLYDSIAKEGCLEDPYQVFDLDYFKKDPTIFWRFAHKIFPDKNPAHSDTHYFIAELENHGKLQRLYSQNVDTLECGVPESKLRCVHGSWRNSYCLSCGKKFDIEDLREAVQNGTVPTCPCGGQIKPGIVFFGQKTNIEDEDITADSEEGDLLIVIGTSLKVAPISMLPEFFSQIPSILINREPVTCNFSAEFLGDCSDVVKAIQKGLGWKDFPEQQIHFNEPNKFFFPDKNGNISHVYETGPVSFVVTPCEANPNDLL